MTFHTKEEIEAYYKGLKNGAELGATMDPSEYNIFVHNKKLALLKTIDREREVAMEEFYERQRQVRL